MNLAYAFKESLQCHRGRKLRRKGMSPNVAPQIPGWCRLHDFHLFCVSVPSTICFRLLNRFHNSRFQGGCTFSCYSSVSPHLTRHLAPFGNTSLVYLVDSLLVGAGSGFQCISMAVADATELVFASGTESYASSQKTAANIPECVDA